MTEIDAAAAEWQALLAQDLKGLDPARLVARTLEGIAIEPLYWQLDESAAADAAAPRASAAHPGHGWRIAVSLDVTDALAGALESETLDAIDRVVLRCDAGTRAGTSAGGVTAAQLDGLAARAGAAGGRVHVDAGLAGGVLLGRGFTVDVDPVGAALAAGRLPGTLDALLASALEAGESARPLASGEAAHEAGGHLVQTLALAAASYVAWLRAGERLGMPLEDVAARVTVRLPVGRDFFREIAALRAMRLLIGRVHEACGLDPSTAVTIEAAQSRRTTTAWDPWTNLLRATVATAAAACGGADAIETRPFDADVGASDELALRLARNTQLVLLHESHLGAVRDPARGSWAIESQTSALARAAWGLLQEIERDGGLEKALVSGSLAQRIASTAATWRARLRKRADAITGLSEYALGGETRLTRADRSAPPRPDGVGAQAESSLGPVRTFTPAPPTRDAEEFEALRDRAAACAAAGAAPRARLVTSGELPSWKARGDWTTNLLAAGGISADVAEPTDDASSAAADFATHGTAVAVLVASDETHAARARDFAQALRSAGARAIVYAGRPADEAPLREAGVTHFVYVGCDVVEVLASLLDAMEADA